jgi:hypothetical protein
VPYFTQESCQPDSREYFMSHAKTYDVTGLTWHSDRQRGAPGTRRPLSHVTAHESRVHRTITITY